MSGPPTPTRPRHAASLVILREQDGCPQVLMGRRAPKNRFMPDVFVFPGGGVQSEDAAQRCASELPTRERAALEERASPRLARALGVAAVRETFEETGLAFGRVEGGRVVPELAALTFVFRAITPTESPIRYHARFFLAAEERVTEGALRSNGELLDLAWFDLAEARSLPLIDVTEDVLDEVERHHRGQRPDRVPLFHYRRGKRQVRR